VEEKTTMSTKNNSENATAAENSLKPEESDSSKFMPMENREDWGEAIMISLHQHHDRRVCFGLVMKGQYGKSVVASGFSKVII
jgi:hypothetical protein